MSVRQQSGDPILILARCRDNLMSVCQLALKLHYVYALMDGVIGASSAMWTTNNYVPSLFQDPPSPGGFSARTE